jgi:diguanylate cyclase (GGDEF)-like protein
MKILVADDSKTTRTLLISSLNKLGHEVIEAANGQEAIELFKQNKPDLIILDVIMEGIDGFECARIIRSLDENDWIPIIFLSGAVDDENIARGINAGGDDYLTKPYSEITLFAKIKAMQRIADMRASLCEMTEKFSLLSSTDALTGIYNRLQFDRAILEKIAYARRYHSTFALLFLDLDKFKAINDSLGHFMGDLLLVEVAKRLRSCVRLDDFLSRLGGDEFAIILNEVQDKKVISEIAEKIIHTIEQPYSIAGNNIQIGCSIGIACYPDGENDESNIIKHADIAMYHAKLSGRNNYQYFTEELGREHDKEDKIKGALKHALLNNEFVINYHPVFHLESNEIYCFEALLCWESKKYGKMGAEHFIPLLEEMDLIDEAGSWVLRAACEQMKKWYLAGFKNIRVSVNVSPRQLTNKNFPAFIENIIKDTKLPANLLELELTENSRLIYSPLSESIINEIHKIGVNITLDDFGMGYSSLNYLRKLPISAIKIDKSFVKNIDSNVQNKKIIKSVIALGENLEFDVIAKGIETEDQLKFLLENKCKLGQGYYLSQPLTSEEATKILQTETST